MTDRAEDRIGILGAGLIGTSIGMALARRHRVPALLVDADRQRADTAAALGAGMAGTESDLEQCDHVVIAVPPAAIATSLLRIQRLNLHATFSDVGSVKNSVVTEAETLGCDLSRYCPAHPIAGRERGGPAAAVPELFDDAIWVSTPTVETSAQARADVRWLAEQCGGRAVEMSALEHDQSLAVVSHLPQFVASLLAGQLPDAGPAGPKLAGRGFRDMTRLADSDPSLWVQIAMGNRAALAAALTSHAAHAREVVTALESGAAADVERVLRVGRDAREALPSKRLRSAAHWARLGVVLQDQPGELARLFGVAGVAGVNIEDVTIDHATEHPVGLVVLDVAPDSAERLADAVRDAGWHAVPIA